MAWLNEWVRTIIILVFFAGFLELLLPSGNMRPMVQVLVGLFVLLLLLGPVSTVADLIRQQPGFGLPEIAETATDTLLKEGHKLEEQQFEQILTQYRINIEQQVLSLLKFQGSDNIKARVMVDIIDQPGADLGRLCSITVILESEQTETQQVEPEKISALLAEFYDLTADKVKVRWE
ncbi:MAG: stage III sporulation protein AF [Firmicutes bacterium]|nr:stage III sporulation protein AF [Bacillota bacterium]